MAFERLRRLTGEGDKAEVDRDVEITFGIEEEFWLVDPDSRDIIADPDPGIFDWCEKNRGPHGFVHELLRSQIETNTRVCESVADLRGALVETRRVVLDAAKRHGAAVLAASTHPFAAWESQMRTPKERYERLATRLQESARRLLVSGMHIHAGFGDADSRIRIMTAMRRYLPLLHALSTSSPFTAGRETGYKSYRLTIMGALPRTGLPGPMWSRAEFDQLVADYQRMNLIGDGSELWWDIRPSVRFPTIELRICDLCPRIDDAMCIAAMYACLIRRLSAARPRRRAAGRAPHGDHQREPLARPSAMACSASSATPTRAAARTLRTSPRSCWRNWPPTPPPWAARRSCNTPSPSSARAPAPTARSTCFACGGWKETPTRRPCARWWIW